MSRTHLDSDSEFASALGVSDCSAHLHLRDLWAEVLKKMNFFLKNRKLATFAQTSAFAQGSGETTRRGRPHRPHAITGRVAAPSDFFQDSIILPRVSRVAHIDLIEHVIECLRIVHLGIQTA